MVMMTTNQTTVMMMTITIRKITCKRMRNKILDRDTNKQGGNALWLVAFVSQTDVTIAYNDKQHSRVRLQKKYINQYSECSQPKL